MEYRILAKRFKLMALSMLGAPLMLLTPLFKRSARWLEEQYENNPDSLPEEVRESMYFTRLKDQAYKALKSGEYENAGKLATEQIKLAAKFKGHWNHGNAIHHGNTILGFVALKNRDLEQAEKYLLKSAKIEGSPQLDTHGPCFSLAMELMVKGRKETVLQYLSSVEEFWEYGFKCLPKWRGDVKNGEIPDGWSRLEH
jgi:hypothetical protein